MIMAILNPILLRRVARADFDYPRAGAVVLLSLLGIGIAFDPQMAVQLPELSVPVRIVLGMAGAWAAFAVMTMFLRWWLRRGQRWDGNGNLFHLIVAVSAIDIVAAGLAVLGVPPLLTLPLWVYSIWVAGQAMESALGVSLGYAVAGVVLSSVPVALVSGLVSALLMTAFVLLGLVPLPAMP